MFWCFGPCSRKIMSKTMSTPMSWTLPPVNPHVQDPPPTTLHANPISRTLHNPPCPIPIPIPNPTPPQPIPFPHAPYPLLLILFYVSTQCFHACWHVHLIHYVSCATPHGQDYCKPAHRKDCSCHFRDRRCLSRFQGSLSTGKATSPPIPFPLSHPELQDSSRLEKHFERLWRLCLVGVAASESFELVF